VSLFKI